MMMAWIWMGCACGEQNIKKERFYTSQLLVIEVFQCLIVWMVFRNNTICTQTQWQKAIFIILVSLSVKRVNVLVRNAHKQDFSSFCSWLVVKTINHDLPLFTTRDIIHSIQHNQLHSLSYIHKMRTSLLVQESRQRSLSLLRTLHQTHVLTKNTKTIVIVPFLSHFLLPFLIIDSMGGLSVKSIISCATFLLLLYLFCMWISSSFLTSTLTKTQELIRPRKENHVLFRFDVWA